MYSRHCYFLCIAKPEEQKLNQTHHAVEEHLPTETLTSAAVEKTLKTKPVPHSDTNDDDIFADMFSSSSKTKSNAGLSKQSAATVADIGIFAAEPASSVAKMTRPKRTLQSKKASDVTNVFNIEDDDDDIFAIKPSSVSTAKSSVTATGSTTQKVV